MFRIRLHSLLGCGIGLLSLVAVSDAYAQAAYEFTSARVSNDSSLSLGFAFTVNNPVNVTALGYFDNGGDGFLTQHEVGIFNANGTLLTSTLLNAGSGDPLVGHYRYRSISTFSLVPGTNYVMSATTYGSSDAFAYGTAGDTLTGFNTDANVNIAGNASRYDYQADNVLRLPTTLGSYTIYGGPDFLIDAAPSTPEPSSLALLAAMGLSGTGLLARRKKVRQSHFIR